MDDERLGQVEKAIRYGNTPDCARQYTSESHNLMCNRDINPTLRLYKTTHSITPLEGLFDLRAYTSAPLPAPNIEAPSHVHGDVEEHKHFGQITTITIPLPPLSTQQYNSLNRFLEDTLWTTSGTGESRPADEHGVKLDILRTKGLIRLVDGREYVLQGVTDVFELKEVVKDIGDDRESVGKVVFIGRGVGEKLRRDLLAALDG